MTEWEIVLGEAFSWPNIHITYAIYMLIMSIYPITVCHIIKIINVISADPEFYPASLWCPQEDYLIWGQVNIVFVVFREYKHCFCCFLCHHLLGRICSRTSKLARVLPNNVFSCPTTNLTVNRRENINLIKTFLWGYCQDFKSFRSLYHREACQNCLKCTQCE